MNRKLSFIVGVFACAYVALSAQALPPGVQKGPSMGGITQYHFPNGLKVLLYPDAAEPKVTFNVTYLVGSRHEGYGETGHGAPARAPELHRDDQRPEDQGRDRRARRRVERHDVG